MIRKALLHSNRQQLLPSNLPIHRRNPPARKQKVVDWKSQFLQGSSSLIEFKDNFERKSVPEMINFYLLHLPNPNLVKKAQ